MSKERTRKAHINVTVNGVDYRMTCDKRGFVIRAVNGNSDSRYVEWQNVLATVTPTDMENVTTTS